MCDVFPVSCQWYINNAATFDTKLDVFDKLTGGVLPSHVLELCGPSGLYRQSADIFINTTRIGGLLELEKSLVHWKMNYLQTPFSQDQANQDCATTS